MARFIKSFRQLKTSTKFLCVVGGVTFTGLSVFAIEKRLYREEKKVHPRDTVILHQIGRGPYAPSLIPFAVKLETYLRMAKIPYQNDHSLTPSKKGKFPWIEYNDESIADSTLCIKFLNEKYGIDLNKHLRPAERGIAQSMQVMAEEHLYWCGVCHDMVFNSDHSFTIETLKINKFVYWLMRRNFKKQTWAQGMGRHTEEEVTKFMKRDLQALSDFLGQKKFLMGDEPCEVDCALFGQLSQLHWHAVGRRHETVLKDEFPILAAYCERMKTSFWPDWDQCITHGGTKEATK